MQAVVALRVAGRPRVGSTLRATLTHGAAPVRWYRCAPEAAPHDCVAVSRAATYTVGAADTGAELEARALTTSFGGLWLAASSRLAVG
ncbi:MAG: hypothetical protein HOQ03_03960 [Thermoleophilia bacterium]|nr:hypothetical protein [Thermoleophilia bacterium]